MEKPKTEQGLRDYVRYCGSEVKRLQRKIQALDKEYESAQEELKRQYGREE